MFVQLNRQLMEISEKMREKYVVKSRLERAEQRYNKLKRRLKELETQLFVVEKDIEKLERFSLSGLMYSIVGTRVEKMEQKQQEYETVKSEYNQHREELEHLEKEVRDLKFQIGEFNMLERQYEQILNKKEEMLRRGNDENTKKLMELSEQLNNARRGVKELREAIEAGRAVLGGLGLAINSLQGAKNWGTWDMLGGGMLSTAVKHSKIEDARNEIYKIQHLLQRFRKELQDVGRNPVLRIEIGSFATFADYFFDGLIADWTVQSRINNAIDNVHGMTRQIERIMSDLKASHAQIGRRINQIEYERKELIEKA